MAPLVDFQPFLFYAPVSLRLLISGLVVFTALAGCDSAEEPVPTLGLPDEAHYAWSMESRLVESDSLLYHENVEAVVRAVDRDASVPGYAGLVELEIQVFTGRSRSWYESTARHLRNVAYASAGETPMVEPRPAAGVEVYGLPRIVADLVAEHRHARSAEGSDSVIVRTDPRVVYELPLEVGASWVSFTEPFGSTREVIGRETITVEAGTFDCFVVRTEVDLIPESEEFEWLDYVSEEHGLVLRTIESVQEHRGPDNLPSGQFLRTTERLELTAGG